MDNYAGVRTLGVQPAEVVDNRYKWFLAVGTSGIRTNNFTATSIDAGLFGNQTNFHRDHKLRGFEAMHIVNDIFSIQFEINHKNSIAYSLRFNTLNSVDGLPEDWTSVDYDKYQNMTLVNVPIAFKSLSYQRFVYSEHAFSYGRVVREDDEHYIKAGGSAKIINALDAGYLMAREGTVTFTDPNSPQMQINSSDIQFGIAENQNSLVNRTFGIGLDLGVVYEYRPDYKSFFYDMDGETHIPRYDVNKYKYKAGVSVTNIGFVRFEKDTTSYDFLAIDAMADGNQLVDNPFAQNPLTYIQQATLNGPGVTKAGFNKDHFNMSLPMSLNLQFDYHIWKNYYVSYAGNIPFSMPGDANHATLMTFHAITPRVEKGSWSFGTPISIRRNGILNIGLVGRISLGGRVGVYAGSSTMCFLVGVRKQYDFGMFGGVSVSLKHSVPKDEDLDLVSDKMDRCMYDPGPWIYRGCPDTDGDKIIDLEDHCIYDAGPEKTDGCPDRDEDGVIDVNDRCPDITGLAVHHGCPDRDMDGVIDLADRCPDVPGIELNNGCPFENQGCCTDNDGDGISNLVDRCPEVSGSVYNEGCPIDSSNIGKVNFDKIKPVVDPNHSNNQIKDTLKSGSTEVDKGKEGDPIQISSLKDIPVMNTGKEQDKLMVYFDVDQSFLQESYVKLLNELIGATDYKGNANIVFVVIGHTDADGSDNYNLLLSKRRSETVKKHLINQGIPANQIEVYFYGEWQPLYSDDNEEHKGINRRAEVKVMKK